MEQVDRKERNRIRSAKYRAANLEKSRASVRLNGDKNKDRNRMRKYFKRYGITERQRDEIFARQGYACVCGATEPGSKWWHTDHNHITGKVRGILCHGCNLALGNVKDNPFRLQKLIAYLGG